MVVSYFFLSFVNLMKKKKFWKCMEILKIVANFRYSYVIFWYLVSYENFCD